MSEEDKEDERHVVSFISIQRVLTLVGEDRLFCDWEEDATILELLGLVEYARARHLLLSQINVEADEEEEE